MTTPDRMIAAARSAEVVAFLDTLQTLPAGAVTACRGWTVHEIIAHLTAGCVAVADQAEAHACGDAVPPFGSWQERDDSYRRVDDRALRIQLDRAESRMTAALVQLARDGADPIIPGGGWGFTVSHLATHFRQEFALHRWDFIGDDAIGDELLSQPSFADHSVNFMGQWLLARGLQADPAPGKPFDARIRGMACDGAGVRGGACSDVVVRVAEGSGTLELAEPVGRADVVCVDPAAALLLIWGRRPSDSRRIVSAMPNAGLERLMALLSGF